MSRNRLNPSSRTVFSFIFIAYAIVLTPFLDSSSRNYLVLFAAALGLLSIIGFRLRIVTSAPPIALLLIYMFLVHIFFSGTNGLLSAALTGIYAIGYIALYGLTAKPWFGRQLMLLLLGRLIIAFALVSVLQMITSVASLPVPNLIGSKGLFSYNALSMEPSHLGRVVGISMLAYLIIAKMEWPEDKLFDIFINRWKVVVAFLLTMLLSGSALAAMAIIAVLVLANSRRWILAASLFFFVAWPFAMTIEYEPLQRSVLLLSSLSSLDVDTVFRAEGSGALRLIPSIIYLEESNPSDPWWWIGYGEPGLNQFFLGRIPSLTESASAGFVPGFAVVYGIAGFALFIWTFVLRYATWATAPIIAFWIAFYANSAWNTQVLWFGLIILRLVYVLARDHSRMHERRRRR